MKSHVLYFPYINIPETTWLTQMVLYWDKVSSIVPYEYIQKPESLGPHMLSLVRAGLVEQVIPGAHIGEIPQFADRFLGYLEELGPTLDARRASFAGDGGHRIHVEKMGRIGKGLTEIALARPGSYPWYVVERETANDFMSYLAVSLGQLPAVDAAPVTEDGPSLDRLAHAGGPTLEISRQLDSLRTSVLNEVLPVPKGQLEWSAIRVFKERHRGQLGDFRRRVERELIAAANISDLVLRQRSLELFYSEAAERIDEIQEEMRGAGWRTAKTGLSVIAVVPGASQLFGLVGAIWEAMGANHKRELSIDFAYAAHVDLELGRAG